MQQDTLTKFVQLPYQFTKTLQVRAKKFYLSQQKLFYCKVKCYLFPSQHWYQLILGLARLGLRRNHNMPKTKINAGIVVMSRSMSTFLSLVQCTGCSIDSVVFTETTNLQ
jgi:hypothetical protein